MAKSPKIIVQKATAFQLNPKHSYIINLPGEPTFDETEALQAWLKDQGIEKVLIVCGTPIEISEVPELPGVEKKQ